MLMQRAEGLRSILARKIPKRFRALIAVEDILQDVWIAAFRARTDFRPTDPGAFDRWLMVLTSRRLADALRTVGAMKRGGLQHILREGEYRRTSLADVFGRFASPDRTPSREVSAREAAHAVQIALSCLPEPRRRAVHMRYIEGRSRAEIARRMHKTDSAVNSLLYHGLRDLRERLGDACQFLSDGGSSADQRS